MGRRKLFPDGKMKRINVNVNSDFELQTMEEIKPIVEKYHLKPGETESELIKRIQNQALENVEKECLKSKKE